MIKIMHRLMKHTGKYAGRIRLSYITSLLKGILMKLPMILCFLTISSFMEGSMDSRKCTLLLIALLAGIIVQALFDHLTNVLQSATGYMVFADMRLKLGEHLRKLPMGYFTDGNMGKISSVLSTDMVFIEENCMGVLADLVSFMISQGLMIIMMLYLNPLVGSLSLLVTAVFILIGNLMLKTTLDHSSKKQKCAEELTDAVLDFSEGIGVIKSYNMLGERSKDLTENFEKSCRESIRFEMDYSPWAAALNLTYGLGTVAILILSSFLYSNGSLSRIYFIGVILFLFDLFISVKSYYGQMARLTVTKASLDRIEEVFNTSELDDNGVEILPETHDGSEISYENVSFGYTGKDVLHDINLSVDKGEMLALVGPSGGGKSTIASLLARLWDVGEGSVKIRGMDIRQVPLSRLMDNISVVFQRVYLFQDTVYNNIAIGRPEATKEEVTEAARKARCLEFIEELPEGFDTVLGEGGASLSGGEKQRISIARCLLKDSPIIVLDEATASVDADNEKAIQDAINELVLGKTIIVIAHRLKTIRNANKIAVIADGRVMELGTHDELIKKGGIYAAFQQR